MKKMSRQDALKRIANDLYKEFREQLAGKAKTFSLGILRSFRTWVSNTEGMYTQYRCRDGAEIVFEGLPDAEAKADFSREVYNALMEKSEKAKPKGMMVFPRTHTEHTGPWYSERYHTLYDGVRFILPCRGFAKLNKRLVQLGIAPIDPQKWADHEVFGKRSNYHITDSHFKCTSDKSCEEVLAFLKGRKRASAEYKRYEDMEDREYGERYETEWGGSIHDQIVVKTADGTQTF